VVHIDFHWRVARQLKATTRIVALCALLASMASTPATASAQDASHSRLILGDLYGSVRRESPRAEAARALARAAQARIPSAKLPPDPELQLGFMNYSLPGLEPMDPLGMTQLQLMQMIPVAGKLGISGRIATAQALAQAERASDVEWELRSDAAMAFYELYQTDQGLAVSRETLRLLQDTRRIAESMFRVGEGRQAAVLRARSSAARLRSRRSRTAPARPSSRRREAPARCH